MATIRLFHYQCDGTDDRGWGCVWRCAQMLLGSILSADAPVPTLRALMVDMGVDAADTRPAARWIEPKQVRTIVRRWVGPSPAFDLVVYNPVPARMLHTASRDFDRVHADRDSFHADVLCHLRSSAHPVVVDDGTYGYCIIGVEEATACYVIADPHRTHRGTQIRRFPYTDFFAPGRMWMALVTHLLPVSSQMP